MPKTKRYRIGNQAQKYELSEKYLGWVPEGMRDWNEFIDEHFPLDESTRPEKVTLVNPQSNEKETLTVHQNLTNAVFPIEFLTEVRIHNWWRFLKVSKEDEVQFIIPMH